MAVNSSRKTARRKTSDRPKKPYAAFPLYAHALGYWSCKIKGKILHFGRWGRVVKGKLNRLPYEESWQAALAAFNARVNDAKLGAIQETVVTEKPTACALVLGELCDRFLHAKRLKLESGELSPRSFQEYEQTTDLLINQFGNTRQVESLSAEDFEQLRAAIAKRCGPVRLGNEITRVRSVFKYAYNRELIDKPIRCLQPRSSIFEKPTVKVLRRHKSTGGKKLFAADELRLILDVLEGKEATVHNKKTGEPKKVKLNADPQLRAAVLLGINCGAGNTDVANLQFEHLDLKAKWLNYARGKTGIPRRVPLWTETIAALQNTIAGRPEPKDKADSECVFLTARRQGSLRGGGTRLVKLGDKSHTDYIGRKFGKLLRSLGINGRKNLGFYTLRHTLATIGLQTGDRDAVKSIMGHADGDMLSVYDETGPSDERLQAVVQHVHAWLFGEGGAI